MFDVQRELSGVIELAESAMRKLHTGVNSPLDTDVATELIAQAHGEFAQVLKHLEEALQKSPLEALKSPSTVSLVDQPLIRVVEAKECPSLIRVALRRIATVGTSYSRPNPKFEQVVELRGSVHVLRDLEKFSRQDLLKSEGMGARKLAVLEEFLNSQGIRLREG